MILVSKDSPAFAQKNSSLQEETTNQSWKLLMAPFDLNQTYVFFFILDIKSGLIFGELNLF